jgi:hypothetical protein
MILLAIIYPRSMPWKVLQILYTMGGGDVCGLDNDAHLRTLTSENPNHAKTKCTYLVQTTKEIIIIN